MDMVPQPPPDANGLPIHCLFIAYSLCKFRAGLDRILRPLPDVSAGRWSAMDQGIRRDRHESLVVVRRTRAGRTAASAGRLRRADRALETRDDGAQRIAGRVARLGAADCVDALVNEGELPDHRRGG